MQLTSTHWGTYRYETENGKVTALTPFEDDTAKKLAAKKAKRNANK